MLVRRAELEESSLRGLADSVLQTEVIAYAVTRMEEALRKRFEDLDAELGHLRQRKQQIEAEIARLVQAIADGQPSQSTMAAIAERERALRGNLIAHPASVGQARTALAEHFGAFTLEPVSRDGKAAYLVDGKLDFFGDEADARLDCGCL